MRLSDFKFWTAVLCFVLAWTWLAALPAQAGEGSFFDDFNDGVLLDDWSVCDGDPAAWRSCQGHACVDRGSNSNDFDHLLCRGGSDASIDSMEAQLFFPSNEIQLGLTIARRESREKGVFIDQEGAETRIQVTQVGGLSHTCFFGPWTFPRSVWVRWEVSGGFIRVNVDGLLCEVALSSPAAGPIGLYRDGDPSNQPGAWFDNVSVNLQSSHFIFRDGFESGDFSAWTKHVGE